VFPVRYKQGFYIAGDGTLHSHRRENFKSSTVFHLSFLSFPLHCSPFSFPESSSCKDLCELCHLTNRNQSGYPVDTSSLAMFVIKLSLLRRLQRRSRTCMPFPTCSLSSMLSKHNHKIFMLMFLLLYLPVHACIH
jgi:hypothetical protein